MLDPDSIFVALVAIVTYQFGKRPGLAVTALAALVNNFFFTPPIWQFTTPRLEEVLTAACMLACVAFIRPHPRQ